MTTMTLGSEPSRVELELALRAALLQAGPREVGRERAQRATARLVAFLSTTAALVALLDVALLLGWQAA